jgi:hypothetical protein
MSILSRLLHKKDHKNVQSEFEEPEELKQINNVVKAHPSDYPQIESEEKQDSNQ